MRNIGLFFGLAAVFAAAQAADITTTDGKTYRNYTVASYSAEGLTILHSEGAVMIPLERWPKERREEISRYIRRIEKRRERIRNRPDLTTKTGTVFKKYKILNFQKNDVRISHWGGVSLVKIDELPDEIRKQYREQIEKAQPKVLILETGTQESNFPKNMELTAPEKRSRRSASDEIGTMVETSVKTGNGSVSIGGGTPEKTAVNKARKTANRSSKKKSKN